MSTKIYTRTGDGGETSLVSGRRVPKINRRIEAYGTVDELNSALGIAVAQMANDDPLRPSLRRVQNHLFHVGSNLSCDDETVRQRLPGIAADEIRSLETEMDAYLDELPALKNFILPGGTSAAASLHLARTICRRAERRVLGIAEDDGELNDSDQLALKYLNRLSDWLFVVARLVNWRAGMDDLTWLK